MRLSVFRLFRTGDVVQNRRSALLHVWHERLANEEWKIYCHRFALSAEPQIWKYTSFGRTRQNTAPKSVPRVQHDCFSSFNQSNPWFVALLLPLPSSFLNELTFLFISETNFWILLLSRNSSTKSWKKNFSNTIYVEIYYEAGEPPAVWPSWTNSYGRVFIILAQQNVDANCKLEKASCDRILKPILGLCLPARLAIGCPLLPQFEFSLFCLIDKTKAIKNGDEQTVKKTTTSQDIG